MITYEQALRIQRAQRIWQIDNADRYYPTSYTVRKVQTYVRKPQIKLWFFGGGWVMVVKDVDNDLFVYNPRRVPQPMGTSTYMRG